MEPDILRLILLLAGLALVLGIYFWDRRKRADRNAERAQREQWRAKSEEDDDHLDIDEELRSLDQLMHAAEPADAGDEPAAQGPAGKARQDDLFGYSGSAETPKRSSRSKARPAYEPPDPTLPTKILQINLVARGGYFEGNDILRAAYDTGLEAGDMNIFHRYPPGKKAGEAPVVFSMASLMEPGFFPLEDMSEYSTPGLTLFAQLPGPVDGLAVFADILFTAERMATVLDAELQDETHSHLTKQTVEHMREEILEHRRKIQLVKSKR